MAIHDPSQLACTCIRRRQHCESSWTHRHAPSTPLDQLIDQQLSHFLMAKFLTQGSLGAECTSRGPVVKYWRLSRYISERYKTCSFDFAPLEVETTAAVLVSQAEAIVRSPTIVMAAADSNGYLKSNYMLNIDNGRTKHYTYSYIHVQTFT